MTTKNESQIVTAMRDFVSQNPEHAAVLLPLAENLEKKIEQLTKREVDVQAVIGAWARARLAYTKAARKHVMED